jgi:hypothetical protein
MPVATPASGDLSTRTRHKHDQHRGRPEVRSDLASTSSANPIQGRSLGWRPLTLNHSKISRGGWNTFEGGGSSSQQDSCKGAEGGSRAGWREAPRTSMG